MGNRQRGPCPLPIRGTKMPKDGACALLITSGQSNLTIAFARWRQYPPTTAHWRHLANTIELVLPSAHSSPQTATRSVQSFLHSLRRSLYTLQWAPLSPKIASCHGGSGPHLTHDSLGHDRFNRFCTGDHSEPILYNGPPLPLKIALSHGASGPSSNR